MADTASRDQNYDTTLLGVSSVDGVSTVTLYANPSTHRLLVDTTGGTNPVADGTYTLGLGDTQDGTITITNGVITAIQQVI